MKNERDFVRIVIFSDPFCKRLQNPSEIVLLVKLRLLHHLTGLPIAALTQDHFVDLVDLSS